MAEIFRLGLSFDCVQPENTLFVSMMMLQVVTAVLVLDLAVARILSNKAMICRVIAEMDN